MAAVCVVELAPPLPNFARDLGIGLERHFCILTGCRLFGEQLLVQMLAKQYEGVTGPGDVVAGLGVVTAHAFERHGVGRSNRAGGDGRSGVGFSGGLRRSGRRGADVSGRCGHTVVVVVGRVERRRCGRRRRGCHRRRNRVR